MEVSDLAFSMLMRDIINSLVREQIDTLRPRYRYATVDSIDRVSRKCGIIFNGESGAVTVNMGGIQPNAVGQIVRVEGIGTDKFITDVIGQSYSENLGNLDRLGKGFLAERTHLQFAINGGGIKSVAADKSISWSTRFLAISVNKGGFYGSGLGYFEIAMPANGTVIQNVSGGANVTVANGKIVLPDWGILWYKPPWGAVSSATVPGNFRITQYNVSDFTPEDDWILVCAINLDPGVPMSKWADGSLIDCWRVPALVNGWVEYDPVNAGYYAPRYRKLATGEVEVQGLVKSGTAALIFTLPVGYRLGGTEAIILPTMTNPNAITRLDILPGGNLQLSGAYDATWVSVCCKYFAEG